MATRIVNSASLVAPSWIDDAVRQMQMMTSQAQLGHQAQFQNALGLAGGMGGGGMGMTQPFSLGTPADAVLKQVMSQSGQQQTGQALGQKRDQSIWDQTQNLIQQITGLNIGGTGAGTVPGATGASPNASQAAGGGSLQDAIALGFMPPHVSPEFTGDYNALLQQALAQFWSNYKPPAQPGIGSVTAPPTGPQLPQPLPVSGAPPGDMEYYMPGNPGYGQLPGQGTPGLQLDQPTPNIPGRPPASGQVPGRPTVGGGIGGGIGPGYGYGDFGGVYGGSQPWQPPQQIAPGWGLPTPPAIGGGSGQPAPSFGQPQVGIPPGGPAPGSSPADYGIRTPTWESYYAGTGQRPPASVLQQMTPPGMPAPAQSAPATVTPATTGTGVGPTAAPAMGQGWDEVIQSVIASLKQEGPYGAAELADQQNAINAQTNADLATREQQIRENFGARGMGTSGIQDKALMDARMGADAARAGAFRGTMGEYAAGNYAAQQGNREAGLQMLNALLGQGEQGLTARGQDISRELGWGELGTTQRGQDISRELGLGEQGLTGRGQDITQQLGLGELDLNRLLGMGNIGLTGRQQDISRELGLGGLGLQRELGLGQLDLDKLLGLGGLGTTQRGQSLDYMLGQGGLSNEYTGQMLNYMLGLGGLGNQARGQTLDYSLGTRGQDLQRLLGLSELNQGNTLGRLGLGTDLWKALMGYQQGTQYDSNDPLAMLYALLGA